MLESERIHRLVLELPRDDRLSISVSGHDSGDETRGRGQKVRLILRPYQDALSQQSLELVLGDVVVGAAEILDRANREDHPLPRSHSGRELPVEVPRIEFAGARFDAIPVGPEAQQLEGILEQRVKRGRAFKSESLHLARPETDSEQRRIPRRYRNPPPVLVRRTLRTRKPQTEHGQSRNCAGRLTEVSGRDSVGMPRRPLYQLDPVAIGVCEPSGLGTVGSPWPFDRAGCAPFPRQLLDGGAEVVDLD